MQENKPISHFIAGAIIAAALVIYSLILQFAGLGQSQALGWIAYIILIGGLIIFINLYGKAKNFEVSFGGLFSYGFKATAIIALILVIFLIAFFTGFPEFKTKIIEASRVNMETSGKMTDDQIDQAITMLDKSFLMFTVGGALFMYLIIGAIGSLIGAAVTKKKPADFPQ